MKRFLLAAAVVVLAVTGLAVTWFWGPTARAWGQAAQGSSRPHKIGLIDMSEVFKKYKKFEVLREDLKTEIAQSEQKAKQMAGQISTLQKQLKQLQEGSADYVKIEKQLLGLTSDLQAFRQGAKRDFLRKESQIYKTIYLEVADAVQKYSDYYKYTLIVRFNRKALEDADQPREVMQVMNQMIVDYRKEDDITDSVLDYLNRKYGSSINKTSGTRGNGKASSGGTRQR